MCRQANEFKPAFVLIAGDLTQDQNSEQLSAFDKILSRFKVPVRLVPGNHEYSLDKYKQKYGDDYYVFTFNNCDFICLNS